MRAVLRAGGLVARWPAHGLQQWPSRRTGAVRLHLAATDGIRDASRVEPGATPVLAGRSMGRVPHGELTERAANLCGSGCGGRIPDARVVGARRHGSRLPSKLVLERATALSLLLPRWRVLPLGPNRGSRDHAADGTAARRAAFPSSAPAGGIRRGR